MNTLKRGLVHFCGKALRLHAHRQKWTCPRFRIESRSVRKGDRSIFRLHIREDSGRHLKNGPVPVSGFTLLEIILSLAILAGALAALGEVLRLADRSAVTAEDETQAQILAASVMDELVAGSRELSAVDQVAFNSTDDPPWVYSIEMEKTAYDELVAVRVRVEQKLDARLQPAHFELVRWLPNPDFIPADTGEQQSGTSNSSGSSSSSSGSSSSSLGSGGQP